MVNVKDTISNPTQGLTYAGAKANREYYDTQIGKLKNQLAELADKRGEMDNVCFVLRPSVESNKNS